MIFDTVGGLKIAVGLLRWSWKIGQEVKVYFTG